MQDALLVYMAAMFGVLLLGASALGGDATAGAVTRNIYFVNNVIGSDTYDGRSADVKDSRTGPFKTIMHAVRNAAPGSTISMAPISADYREEVRIVNTKKGSPAAPFVLDGNGATVTGLLELPAERWTHLRNDIYWTENRGKDGKPLKMPNSNWLGHWKHQGWFADPLAPEIFFLDGKVARHTQSLETIPVGGFFYDTQSSPRRLYLRLPKGKKIEDCRVELPQNEGVYVEDDYVVVRNLRSIYSQDDGFSGYWGIGCVFENINGSFNCDQGFSMHGTSISLIDGGLFERNGGCGICDVQSCSTAFRNCVVRDNYITGALMMGQAHSFINCRFTGNYAVGIQSSAGTSTMLVNCLVDGNGKTDGVAGYDMRLEHCTVVNCRVGVAVEDRTSITNCVISNCAQDILRVSESAVPVLTMSGTLLDLGTAKIGSQAFDSTGWSASRFAKDNFVGDPGLKHPLYELPAGSKWEKAAAYDTDPGAHLLFFKGWDPTKPNKDPYPHP